MKKLALVFVLGLLGGQLFAQVPVYTWVSGDSMVIRESSTVRTSLGTRSGASSWVDNEDNLWFSGGYGRDSTRNTSYFNDMWKYDPNTKIWTWETGGSRAGIEPINYDNALQFDGIDDFIEIEKLRAYADGFTWELWVKTTDDFSGLIQFDQERNSIYDGGDSVIMVNMYDGYAVLNNNMTGAIWSNYKINDGLWHHIALTMEVNESGVNELVTLYIDGESNGETSGDFDQLIDESDTSHFVTQLGANTPWSNTLDGLMDEVKIWSKARTAEDILASYQVAAMGSKNHLLRGDEPNLVAYYNFNQGETNGDNLNWSKQTFTPVDFTKVDYADPILEANQDRISENIWITRGDSQGLYNAAQEEAYDPYYRTSPKGTLWGYGNTENLIKADYDKMAYIIGSPVHYLNQPLSMYIPDEGRFFNITFTGWTQGQGGGVTNGGGFAYTRTEIDNTPRPDTLMDLTRNRYHGTLVNFKNNGGLLPGSASNWVEGPFQNTAQTGRMDAVSWTDQNDDFWVFGGESSGLLNDLLKYNKVSNEWELITGSLKLDSAGKYGVKGVPDLDVLPGGRSSAVSWTDNSSNLWLFGGLGVDVNEDTDILNDLWKYDIGTNEWTWVSGSDQVLNTPVYGTKGVGNVNNIPGARQGSVSWTDANGDLWLFGGMGLDNYDNNAGLNDLWMYNTLTGEWTWVAGRDTVSVAGNYVSLGIESEAGHPGARWDAVSWYDASDNSLWLFGGQGRDGYGSSITYLNDLWKFSLSTRLWTWMGGFEFGNSSGIYGDKGVIGVDEVPASKANAMGVVSSGNKFWLYGGVGYGDLWTYDPANNNWLWLDGGAIVDWDNSGTYGFVGEGSAQRPGGRDGGLAWTDPGDNLWIFGGNYMSNDFWKYNVQTELWEFMGGDTESYVEDHTYGDLLTSSKNNWPRGRWHGSTWTDNEGNLWMFGGLAQEFDENGNRLGSNILNDLWQYNRFTKSWTWMGGSDGFEDRGRYGEQGVPDVNNIPNARSSSAYWTDEEGNFWLFGGYALSNGVWKYHNDLWKFNPNTLEWTWVTGSRTTNVPGVYGELGVESPEANPGSRRYISQWTDSEGNFWIFGGHGYDVNGGYSGYMNDLWRFNPKTNMWAWMGGPQLSGDKGSYGAQGVTSPENWPNSRYTYQAWTDASNNFWLSGGYGLNAEETAYVNFNDLWKYDLRTHMWTWVGGSDIPNELSYYQIKGEGSIDNVISARERSSVFTTSDNSFFLFGGRGMMLWDTNDPNSLYQARLNDLWEIEFIPGVPSIDGTVEILQDQFTVAYDEAWADQFQIQVAMDGLFANIVQDVSVMGIDTTAISSLQAGTIYYYRINATNHLGTSNFSEPVQVLTLPDTPIDLAIDQLTETTVDISWTLPSGIYDGYYLDVSLDETFTSVNHFVEGYQAKPIVGGETAIQIIGLTAGIKYYARLRTVNATGESPNSEVLNILTTPESPNVGGLKVSVGVTQQTADIQWSIVGNILDGYVVEVANDDTFTDKLVNYDSSILNNETNTLLVEGLSPGTNYFARIYSYNESGLSSPSSTINVLTLPESPIFTDASNIKDKTQTSVVITWSAVPEIFDGYQLEISRDLEFSNDVFLLDGYGAGGIPNVIDKTTPYDTVRGLHPGTTYYARVRAFNSSGVSPNSNVAKIVTVPLSPIFSNVSSITQNSASLSWSIPVGATSFLLDLSINETYTSEAIVYQNLPLAVPFQILDDLEPGTTYYSRIQASNSSGNSGEMTPNDYGDTLFITIPATPFINDPMSIQQTNVVLDWIELKGADGYYIDVSNNGFQTFLTDYNNALLSTNSVDVSGLNPGENYQIRIRSFNVSGESPNSTTFSVLTVPATPVARDATNTSASVFTANWDPVVGATYYTLEVSADDFSTFIHQQTYTLTNPIKISGLSQGTTYKYRIRSGNASGESPNSNTVSVLATNNAQSLAIASVDYNAELSRTSDMASITVNLTGGQGTVNVWMRHKGMTASTWSDSIAVNQSAVNTYTFELSSALLDEVGVEFEVYATDGFSTPQKLGNYIYWSFEEDNSDVLPLAIFGGGIAHWQVFSIPYVLEDNLIETIFNEMGQFEYESQWRLMHYNGTEYVDAGAGINKIELGKGYWFNSVNEVAVKVGKGTVNVNTPFEMVLRQGWNQIGNPYNVPISWNAIRESNNALSAVERMISYNSQVQNFSEGDNISPFGGGFVWANEATTVSIDLNGTNSGGRIEDERITNHDIDEEEWVFNMQLESNTIKYDLASIGMHPEASELKDKYDRTLLPRFFNYLEMYTSHNDYFYPWFTDDVVPTSDEKSWLFELESNFVDGHSTMQWDNDGLQGKQEQLWLIDEVSGQIINMAQVSEYSFNLSAKHSFSLHFISDPLKQPIPFKLNLGDPYPNPTKDISTIEVFLPQGQDTYDVTLEIFDLQGHLVTTVASDRFEPGVYSFATKLTNEQIMNGVYIYRLALNNTNIKPAYKKLILNK